MKYFYEIAPTRIIRSDQNSFTYESSGVLSVGDIVKIPIGKKNYFGVVLKKVSQPTYQTKPVQKIMYSPGVPEALLDTAIWLSEYYSSPLSSVLALLLPPGIGKNRRPSQPEPLPISKRTKKLLNVDQRRASAQIDENTRNNQTSLLNGVTGSGKTQVYIDQALKALSHGKSSVILVPEIALTSQLVSELSLHFPELIIYHSRLTEAKRHLLWEKIVSSDKPHIIVGPRSALFLPIHDLGFVAIDEAHEPSYKQDKTPRYSTLRVARILVNKHKGCLVLGSATPLIEDYHLALKKDSVVNLPTPAINNAIKPILNLIDMTNRGNFKQHRFLSDKLISSIKEGGQTLIYHNRRGSASVTLCENCGWTAIDEDTSTPLVLHIDKNRLVNHLTNQHYPVPVNCPSCAHPGIIHKGIGTKLIYDEVHKLFPNKNIARFDSDNLSHETLEKSYDKVHSGEIDIIIGTQIVAKGLDLPHLKTVAVIQADAGLAIPDFSSSERTFQLISQVSGRVGRNANKTNLIIQTYQPNSPSIKFGVTQNYHEFYQQELKQRLKNNFPPFSYLLKLTCTYKTEAIAVKNAKTMYNTMFRTYPDVEIFGPAPAFYEKIGDKYRWQIIVKSKNRQTLQEIIKLIPSPYWQYELDPTSIL